MISPSFRFITGMMKKLQAVFLVILSGFIVGTQAVHAQTENPEAVYRAFIGFCSDNFGGGREEEIYKVFGSTRPSTQKARGNTSLNLPPVWHGEQRSLLSAGLSTAPGTLPAKHRRQKSLTSFTFIISETSCRGKPTPTASRQLTREATGSRAP